MEKEQRPERDIKVSLVVEKSMRLLDLMDVELYSKWVRVVCEDLKRKYPDYNDYVLWHILAGGSDTGQPKVDFAGEDSILKKLDDKLKEYEKNK
jgi:hypothetical protein